MFRLACPSCRSSSLIRRCQLLLLPTLHPAQHLLKWPRLEQNRLCFPSLSCQLLQLTSNLILQGARTRTSGPARRLFRALCRLPAPPSNWTCRSIMFRKLPRRLPNIRFRMLQSLRHGRCPLSNTSCFLQRAPCRLKPPGRQVTTLRLTGQQCSLWELSRMVNRPLSAQRISRSSNSRARAIGFGIRRCSAKSRQMCNRLVMLTARALSRLHRARCRR